MSYVGVCKNNSRPIRSRRHARAHTLTLTHTSTHTHTHTHTHTQSSKQQKALEVSRKGRDQHEACTYWREALRILPARRSITSPCLFAHGTLTASRNVQLPSTKYSLSSRETARTK